MQKIVDIYNKYFFRDKLYILEENHKTKYAHLKHMVLDADNIYLLEFDGGDLEQQYNSSIVVAKDLGPVVKFIYNGQLIKVNVDTRYDDLKLGVTKQKKRGKKNDKI